MALTKIQPNIIAVANNVTNKTVGNTTSIPSFTFDGAGVVTSASNVAISGAGITANTIANSAFQTGSVENYLNASGGSLTGRNKIINGAMTIDQRGPGTYTPNGTYTLDRWAFYNSQTSKVTVAQNQSSVTPPVGFSNYLGITSSSAYSITSTDYFFLQQGIEGYNIADLSWGTANAKPVTLSFWARSSLTGTFGGSLENEAADRCYVFSYTISAANTWEYKTITIAGDTTGTWNVTTANGIKPKFSVGTGSTYSGTAGTWGNTRYFSVTGATSVVGTSGATFYITGVQLEAGSVATPFEHRQYGTELALCQRYYYLHASGSGSSIAMGTYYSSTQLRAVVTFPVSMRTAPSLTNVSGSDYYAMEYTGGDNFNSFTIYRPSTTAAIIYNGTEASGTTGLAASIITTNATSYVAFSAEL